MGNSIKNKNSLKTMIQTKSITLQAACLAYANALALQSKLLAEAQSQDIFDDLADWTERAFHDVGTAFIDAASWTENAFEDAYDFNYQLMKARVPFDSVYAPLGDLSDPNHKMIEPRDCEDVDCMHPCYGKNQYGACGKCVSHLLENNGARH